MECTSHACLPYHATGRQVTTLRVCRDEALFVRGFVVRKGLNLLGRLVQSSFCHCRVLMVSLVRGPSSARVPVALLP